MYGEKPGSSEKLSPFGPATTTVQTTTIQAILRRTAGGHGEAREKIRPPDGYVLVNVERNSVGIEDSEFPPRVPLVVPHIEGCHSIIGP